MSPIFLRTWYQRSGTCSGGVEPLRLTKMRVCPAWCSCAGNRGSRLLQLALEPLGDLLDRVVERGARPVRLDHHRAEGEGGSSLRPSVEYETAPATMDAIITKMMNDRWLSAQADRLTPMTELR